MQRPLPAAPHARRQIRWQQRPGAGRAASGRASTSNGGSGGDTSGPRGKRARSAGQGGEAGGRGSVSPGKARPVGVGAARVVSGHGWGR